MGDFIDAHSRDKKPLNLLRGWPHPSLLPTPAIASAAQTVLSDPAISIPGLLYGPDPGYQPLREEIARWLSGFYGGQADAERICVTGGASRTWRVFSDPLFTRVWMVAPSYFLACRIFDDAGLVTGAVGEGDEGVDLEGLEASLRDAERDEGVRKIKLAKPWSKIYRHIIYCVPTFSNPSGKTMSLSCRQKLVRLARKYDALIITDDVYDFLLWPTSKSSSTSSATALMPRLVDIDRTMEPVPSSHSFGNAMSNGSFSKIAGPGLRTGWADATPIFTYGLSQCGSSRSGGAPSQSTATMVCELLKSGAVGKHISQVLIPAYRKRYEIMMAAIQQFLLPVGVTVGEVSFGEQEIFGGFFIWIELPKSMSAEEVCSTAKERENLIVAPGRLFEVSGDASVRFETSLRLCFAWEEAEDLEDGIRRLGKVIRDVGEGKSIASRHAGKEIKNDLGEFR
ncbi:Uncharacterized protein LHYA1_G005634 [Lachnellula hyalina]|uniref:Aminotransferase class I/classII large domain-containing protein n=1 Tax=Lachnellula hyalina TaxID=1316788 RepID=A0A8H8QYY2_9HELO|nr:Uncharacterized protein LHYA1_G005634 [Lachnellula hyalina]TVY24725.1 Uncharacterized protein LHYA1_G005634 [Lachnellula hyalina]